MPKLYPLPGPVARSLEVVGDRWTLLVVRELLLGGRRWAELERALPGIPSNLLAERLRLLEEERVVERATEGRVYHLTDKGRDLAPVLASLAAWGTRHCGEPSSAMATHAGCGGRVLMRSSPAPAAANPSPPRPWTSAASADRCHRRGLRRVEAERPSTRKPEPWPTPRGSRSSTPATVGRLLGQLFPVTGDLHEAEEIVQEAFARASTRWARLRDYDVPEAWVRRVAMNLAADRRRRLQRQARALLRAGPPPCVPPVSVEALALAEALRTLPMHQRQAIVLHHLVDLPGRGGGGHPRRPQPARSRAGWPGAAAPWRPRLGDPEEVLS